jgi:DNA mismatch endonuclease (patch repair protein)
MCLSRSAQMARIHGEETSPERVLCAALAARGIVFGAHARTLVGRPGVVIAGAQVANFIDGSSWHGCPTHYLKPRTCTCFWSAKLAKNLERERKQTRDFEALGWRVVRAWEFEAFVVTDDVLDRVTSAIVGPVDTLDEVWRVFCVDVIGTVTDLEGRHMVSLREPRVERFVDAKRTTANWQKPVTK